MFFFQAEDGIRVRDVTGVQTCALPIYFSAVIDVERIDSARRKLREEAPKFLPKTQMRPNKSERFRVERRHIDGIADCPLEQRRTNGLRDFDSNAFLRFCGRGTEMRRQNKFRDFS